MLHGHQWQRMNSKIIERESVKTRMHTKVGTGKYNVSIYIYAYASV